MTVKTISEYRIFRVPGNNGIRILMDAPDTRRSVCQCTVIIHKDYVLSMGKSLQTIIMWYLVLRKT